MLQEQAPPVTYSNSTTRMDFGFLIHLAGTGATDIHPLGQAATRELVSQLDLRPGLRILEVGCGTGGTMVRLAAYNPERIDGVDLIPSMLRVARRRIRLTGLGKRLGLHLVKPGEPLPFPGASYDRVYTESVLGIQDVEGANRLLTEIFRVLKPGGRYVANEAIWREGVPAERVAAINEGCVADFGLRMASQAPWSLNDLLRLMTKAGFRVISAGLVGQHTGSGTGAGKIDARTLLSSTLTRLYQLRSHVVPAARRARARYRELLQKHRDDGLLIEPRLFVLEKPR